MLLTERFSRKGVNPFISHLDDKKWSDHRTKQAQKSRFTTGFSLKREALNHSTRIFVIRIAHHLGGVVLDEVIAANAQPHGDGRCHEHR
jgi:hypothetical protein